MAHLKVIQHLLPGQEQQRFLPDLPGDLGVEEGVLSAAIGHPLGGREENQNGRPCQGRGEGLGRDRPRALTPHGWARLLPPASTAP